MKNLWNKLPRWACGSCFYLALILVLIVVLSLFREAFWAFPIVFAAIWILTPLVLGMLSGSTLAKRLSPKTAIRLRGFSFAASILISFAFFAAFNHVRDRVGYMFVEGYRSYNYADATDYGADTVNVGVLTAHWYSRWLLRLAEWGYLALCFGAPFWTWASGSRLVKSVEEAQNRNDLPGSNVRS